MTALSRWVGIWALGVTSAQWTPTPLHAQDVPSPAATTAADTARQEGPLVREHKALIEVLAVVATALDELEREVRDARAGIYAEIDRGEPLVLDANALSDVQTELRQLRLGERRKNGRVIPNVDYFLVRAHEKYKELKQQNASAPDVKDIDESIHSLLERRGLSRTMSAVVRGGVAAADVANDRQVKSGEVEGQLPRSVSILLGTKHWKDEEWWADFGISGSIGLVPILGLFVGADGEEAGNVLAPEDVVAVHGAGLAYSAYFNVNGHLGSNSELGWFVGGGQTKLNSGTVDIDASGGETNELLELVANGPGLTAYRLETGFEYRLYDQELELVHHDKTLLRPVLSVAGGWRWDERLQAWQGLVMDAGMMGVRHFGRLAFDLRQVFGQRKAEDKGKLDSFGVRLVGEREWGGIAPTANRVLVEADVDLGIFTARQK